MLIEYRKRSNLSRKALADLIEVDERTIFRIEHDTSLPLVDTYAKIVYTLKMSEKETYDELMNIIAPYIERHETELFKEQKM